MKHFIPLLLVCALLSGCGRKGTLLIEPVYLSYPRAEFEYGAADGVIDCEAIEGTGRTADYPSLLAEYFYDPVDESLENPFPPGTQVLSAVLLGNEFRIRLNQTASELTEARFALAATCLSMTCFDLTNCRSVTVISGEKQIAIPRDSWLLLDDYIPDENAKQ